MVKITERHKGTKILMTLCLCVSVFLLNSESAVLE